MGHRPEYLLKKETMIVILVSILSRQIVGIQPKRFLFFLLKCVFAFLLLETPAVFKQKCKMCQAFLKCVVLLFIMDNLRTLKKYRLQHFEQHGGQARNTDLIYHVGTGGQRQIYNQMSISKSKFSQVS